MNRFLLYLRALSFAALAVFSFSECMAQTGAPEEAAAKARQLSEEGNNEEAAKAYEQLLKDYPTSMVVSESQFRLAVTYYILGQYDKSIAMIGKIQGPPTPPEIVELGYSLRPRVTAAKAAKMGANDSKRKSTFEEAIKQYDEYISKYPKGDELESARYGRALASFQIEKFDDAVNALRENIASFKTSDTIGDSRYLLALSLYSQGIQKLFGDKPDVAAATPKLEESQSLFGEIIKGPDISLANDAQFQMGEIFSVRARFVPEKERAALYEKAIASYRAVKPKDKMIEAQQARLAGFVQKIKDAATANNRILLRKLMNQRDRETEKLAVLKEKPDQSLTAFIRVGTGYFNAGKYDEARAVFNHAENFAKSGEPKRDILYYRTLSYVSQMPTDKSDASKALMSQIQAKAIADYAKFQSEFAGDPLGENLPLAIGKLYIAAEKPKEAIPYLDEMTKYYPKTKLLADVAVLKASAYLQLKQFPEALKAFEDVLKTNPSKDVAAGAELGIASTYAQTGKPDEAIKQFRKVRETHPNTLQAEQAHYNVGGLTLGKGDAKGALAEFLEFQKLYPKSSLAPDVAYLAAYSLEMTNDKPGALEKYRQFIKDFPDARNVSDGYMRIANIYANEQKQPEMESAIREFAAKFPEHPQVFAAYRMMAQINLAAQKLPDAIANYRELVDKYPKIPNIADAWRELGDLYLTSAKRLGNYIAMPEDQRVDWEKYVKGAVESVESLIKAAPESPQVAMGLKTLLGAQELQVTAKKKTDADVEKYFQDLASSYAEKPGTKSKILFSLASYMYQRDKQKAVDLMAKAYDPSLVFAPSDVDLYGSALLASNRVDEAVKVYEDLASDYPIPANVAPDRAKADVQQAQSLSTYGLGKALALKGDQKAATEKFEALKKLYPWSPKIHEANLEIAKQRFAEKNYDEVVKLVIPIVKASTATVETKANAMLLLAKTYEEKGDLNNAIDNYGRIATFYAAAGEPAAQGLYKSGELIIQKQLPTLQDAAKKKSQLLKARGFLEKCVKDYAASEWATKAKTLLDRAPKE